MTPELVHAIGDQIIRIGTPTLIGVAAFWLLVEVIRAWGNKKKPPK